MRCTVVLVVLVAASPASAQGRPRELYCRGSSSLVLKVDQDPSPRRATDVVMVLEYKRATISTGDVHSLRPGTCSWNLLKFADMPVEPGHVRFDVAREAQAWSATGTRMMDTTVRAAVFFPDPITLPRYLSDSSHYYKFFLDDATNIAWSQGAYLESGTPTYVTITGPLVLANNSRRDLLCRGGSAGLVFTGVTNVGTNLVKAVLTYRISQTVPGPAGLGLSPGACAWTDRTAMPAEPGKMTFLTARNAQSGTTVDLSPTAAERYPDVQTIPDYLKDPAHYWSFTVMSKTPDSALTHAAWKRDLTDVVATGRTPATSPTVTLPSSVPGGGVFRPGGSGSTSSVTSLRDISNVTVRTGLDGASILFDAAPNLTPTVAINLTDPVWRSGVYEFNGTPIMMNVTGTPRGTVWHYTATLSKPLPRDTRYHYIITAPAGGNNRANQKTGEFKTLGQQVSIVFTQINLLSDGDADTDGEVQFDFQTCPPTVLSNDWIPKGGGTLSWGDGPHNVSVQMNSPDGKTPDKLRIVIYGKEDDNELGSQRYSPPPVYCDRLSLIDPGKNSGSDWNSLIMDFDLTKYPGTKGGEQFVRRSKPLRNGSRLMFEIRGSILVTRQ